MADRSPARPRRDSGPDGAPWHGLTTDAAIAGIVTPAFEAAVRQLISAMAAADKTLAHPLFHSLLDQGYFLGQTLGMCCLSTAREEDHVDGLVDAFANGLRYLTD